VTVIVADVTDADIVEQRPVVGGAAARDRGMISAVDESTPASRASALQAPRTAVPDVPDEEASERPKRHPLRVTLLLLALLALLGGGAWYGWSWSQRQYYVGATPDGVVAVYQGVPGQIAGLHLSRLDHTESITLDQLTKVAQDQVRKGITASSAAEAEQKYQDLIRPENGNMVHASCSPRPSASGSASGTASPSPTGSPGNASSGKQIGPGPALTASPDPSHSGSGSPSPTPSPSPC
jgi:protein phosphatase